MIRSHYRHHLIAAGRASGTVKLRIMHLDHLARRFDLLEAVEHDLTAELARREPTHSPEARKSLRSSMLSFYGWAWDRGIIDTNPAAKLAPISIPRLMPRVAPDDAVADALARSPIDVGAMIMLGRFGCLRLSEITQAHSRDLRDDVLLVVGKGGKERFVPVVPDLRRALELLERDNGAGYYFGGRYGGHMHSGAVGKIITRATGWNPHSLRHAGATAAYLATRNLRAVQILLGHASLATTERYLHLDFSELRAASAGTALRLSR